MGGWMDDAQKGMEVNRKERWWMDGIRYVQYNGWMKDRYIGMQLYIGNGWILARRVWGKQILVR